MYIKRKDEREAIAKILPLVQGLAALPLCHLHSKNTLATCVYIVVLPSLWLSSFFSPMRLKSTKKVYCDAYACILFSFYAASDLTKLVASSTNTLGMILY